MKEFIIRRLDRKDGEALSKLLSSLSPKTIRLFSYHPLPSDYAARFTQREDITCFAAIIDGKMVGFVWWEPNSSPMPMLGICVQDDYQGNGIGKALLERLIREAREQGKEGLQLTVMKENEVATSLYLSFGFKPIAEYTDAKGPNLVMRLYLSIEV
ncbi:MAG: GNAT family N-acetyltransferase, partial [bacterium]